MEFRVLLNTEGIVVANLRFAARANIDKHSAPYEIDVICIQGAGYTQVGDTTAERMSTVAPLTSGAESFTRSSRVYAVNAGTTFRSVSACHLNGSEWS